MSGSLPPTNARAAKTARGPMISAMLMIVFLGLFGLATLADMATGPDSAREEREAPTPPFPRNLGTLKQAVMGGKYYLSQRYFGKQLFVHWNAEAKIDLFGHAPYPKVMIGKQGWLFLGDAPGPDDELSGLIGAPPAPTASDAAWLALFRGTAEAIAARGIPSALLLAPDKSAVMPEMLPDWVKPVAPPRGERLVRQLAGEKTPPVDLFALFRDLRRAEPDLMLYHATDTHWTELGAAIAVDAALKPYGFHAVPAGKPAYAMAPVAGGDLARMIGDQPYIHAQAPIIPRAPQLDCRAPDGKDVQLVTLDPLPAMRFTCTNPAAPADHALVFMDSFGVAAYPRLTQIFKKVDFVWNDRLDLALVDELSPQIVIRIIVARKLQNGDPAKLLIAR